MTVLLLDLYGSVKPDIIDLALRREIARRTTAVSVYISTVDYECNFIACLLQTFCQHFPYKFNNGSVMSYRDPPKSAAAECNNISANLQDEALNVTPPANQVVMPGSEREPGPPPDGGLQAWTQVLMGHLVMINSWGYLTSFGIFQSYYTTSLGATPSAISWIGSVQIFLLYLIGTFSGRALDAGYYHAVLACGSLLRVIAVFMTSISPQYWQLFLAQGICKGLGDGLVFCPTISLVATYFSRNRVFAMACAASGGATGGIIFPVIAQQLLPKIGFAWTVRVMAFVICFNSVVVLSIAHVRLPPRRTGPLVEWSAFKDLPYTLFCVGMFLNLWAVYFAYFYVNSCTNTCYLLSGPDRHSDQHLRERHHQSIFIDISDYPSRHECRWDARSFDLWPHS